MQPSWESTVWLFGCANVRDDSETIGSIDAVYTDNIAVVDRNGEVIADHGDQHVGSLIHKNEVICSTDRQDRRWQPLGKGGGSPVIREVRLP